MAENFMNKENCIINDNITEKKGSGEKKCFNKKKKVYVPSCGYWPLQTKPSSLFPQRFTNLMFIAVLLRLIQQKLFMRLTGLYRYIYVYI